MFEKNYRVPYYGLDENERMKPGILLDIFQESAALHADSLRIGVGDLIRRGLTWVLRRYRVDFSGYPGRDELTVRTWFEPRRNLMSVRRFEAGTAAGDIAASAWSAWIVVDLERGRPVRLDRALPDSYFSAAEPTGDPADEPVPAVSEDCGFEREFSVRRSELDLNGHTNHTVYFDWALESIPDAAIVGLSPSRFDAEFLSSVKREDVTARAKIIGRTPLRFAHSILFKKTGTEAARLSTTWSENNSEVS
jgi:acyl-ACP thioesterase